MSRKKKKRQLMLGPQIEQGLATQLPQGLVTREQTERALRVSQGPEDAELLMGLRRGTSGELWSAHDAAEALAGAQTTEELLAVTREIVPVLAPSGGPPLSSIRRKAPWQQALEEHPPDNAEPEK